MTISFRTNGRHGYAVKFSPYFGHRLLCATSQHYGIAGQGSLFILDFSATGIKVIGRDKFKPRHMHQLFYFQWDPSTPQSLGSFCDHQHVVYSAVWSPHISGTFASVSGDNTLKIWDISAPPHAQQTIRAHNGEVLTCDWARYDPNLVFTGSVDKRIRGWDLRNTVAPVIDLEGHQYAVRRVKVACANNI
ncbi:PREDICTED: peroxisomal targeting signal 2 receptor-like [Acropora digitifera]|uniref:peroxisomal targeting signal 2 receptor-like n=1 Tax=Acropora digitifera TaxID=70779 RepID=UPI00077AC2EF|nr:PREDICTED: peroxisomal targeting signal 2 receptor-like [Acropora digitifera]